MGSELGAFLRSRREAVAPGAVGLPAGRRRRTPGLRRAELATLAGMSVDYLVRLEQGRDRNPSPQVLAALADALRLSEDDRGRLRQFAMVSRGRELCPQTPPAARTVRPAVAAVLARLEPSPAVVLNRLTDILAATDGFTALAGPLGLLDGDPPNLVRFVLEDARASTAFPHLDAVIDAHIGQLGGACRSDVDLVALASEIGLASAGSLTERWERRLVPPALGLVERIHHPVVGELRLVRERMLLADAEDQHLVVFLPGDSASAVALDRLTGRHPGALRAVNNA